MLQLQELEAEEVDHQLKVVVAAAVDILSLAVVVEEEALLVVEAAEVDILVVEAAEVDILVVEVVAEDILVVEEEVAEHIQVVVVVELELMH